MDLNRKMLKFAGLEFREYPKASGKEPRTGWYKGDKYCYPWAPDFLHDLNACEKWLFPWLDYVSLSIKKGGKTRVLVGIGDLLTEGWWDIEVDEIPATALCLAIEKLMEAKK